MNEWADKQNLLLFEVLKYDQPWTLESYRKVGGYSTWENMLAEKPTRDSVIARHIRAELGEAGLPVMRSMMTNRVAYPEASLWGATPSLIERQGTAALEIAAIADEVDLVLGAEQAAA